MMDYCEAYFTVITILLVGIIAFVAGYLTGSFHQLKERKKSDEKLDSVLERLEYIQRD
jgi:hypothetical protein